MGQSAYAPRPDVMNMKFKISVGLWTASTYSTAEPITLEYSETHLRRRRVLQFLLGPALEPHKARTSGRVGRC